MQRTCATLVYLNVSVTYLPPSKRSRPDFALLHPLPTVHVRVCICATVSFTFTMNITYSVLLIQSLVPIQLRRGAVHVCTWTKNLPSVGLGCGRGKPWYQHNCINNGKSP